MPCQSCPCRDLCTVLCPEAELIASQDEVKQRELPVGLVFPRPFPKLLSNTYLTKTETKIVTFWAAGLSAKEISELLEITYNSVKMHKSRIRKKYKK